MVQIFSYRNLYARFVCTILRNEKSCKDGKIVELVSKLKLSECLMIFHFIRKSEFWLLIQINIWIAKGTNEESFLKVHTGNYYNPFGGLILVLQPHHYI